MGQQCNQLLLDKGADVNAQGGQYGNAFKAAAVGGHEKIIQLLIEFKRGASVSLWPLARAPPSQSTNLPKHSKKMDRFNR